MNGNGDRERADREAAARARMAELAAKFIDRSATELVAMQAALRAFESGDGNALAQIRHFAHRMAGTGATLGFESFSDRAFDVEQIAELQSAAAADAARLGVAIQALERELRGLAT